MKTLTICLLVCFFTGIATAATGQFHYVKPLQASIYESPSKTSKVQFIVAIGRKMVEFERKNGFIHVGIDKAGGRSGWIKESDVSPADPDGIKY